MADGEMKWVFGEEGTVVVKDRAIERDEDEEAGSRG